MNNDSFEKEWKFAEKTLLDKEKLEQENKQLKETLKDIEELLLSEEQPVQPCNIRYDILEIIKKALGGKE